MEETGYMAKMRVHELAKELGIENKQIIEFLSTIHIKASDNYCGNA